MFFVCFWVCIMYAIEVKQRKSKNYLTWQKKLTTMHIYVHYFEKSIMLLQSYIWGEQLSVFLLFLLGENNFSQYWLQVMAQGGAGARRRNKSIGSSFFRKVTLIKCYDECTSFSEMRGLKDKKVIEFSSFMTEGNVRNKILETFPYLRNKRWVNLGERGWSLLQD